MYKPCFFDVFRILGSKSFYAHSKLLLRLVDKGPIVLKLVFEVLKVLHEIIFALLQLLIQFELLLRTLLRTEQLSYFNERVFLFRRRLQSLLYHFEVLQILNCE